MTGLGGFTHLAYYHGQIVARRLKGSNARADHTAVPRVTFTDPENRICRTVRSGGAGEIVGELVLGIKLGTPLNTLADVIHPFPAFNRILGESLNELAATVAGKGEHHEQNASQQ